MPRLSTTQLRRGLSGALLALAASAGCGRPHELVPITALAEARSASPAVRWIAPELAADMAALARWRRSVGPPVTVRGETTAPVTNGLVVVNWNMHVGGGDIQRLFEDVRRQAGDRPIVLLLQEAYRAGPEVPATLAPADSFASMIRALRRDGGREDVEAVVSSLGLHAYYVPSMRNGGPLVSDEDRGNAILSTVPLTDLTAIELPFESQRRVAVAASVRGETPAGDPWSVRLVSAHLDNMAGARRLWIAGSEMARARQARGLMTALAGEGPLVLGADLNSWFGFRDSAYLEAARGFPETRVTDHRATFRGLLRLDHLFFRLGDGWSAAFTRAEEHYGSDHYPLIGTISFGS